MNNVSLLGRLGKENELKQSAGGKAILKNSIAVRRDKEKTDWINIVCFGKTAELIAEYFSKGDMIAVTGSIWSGSYDKEGTTVYTTDVCVNQFSFVGGGNQENNSTNAPVPSNPKPKEAVDPRKDQEDIDLSFPF